MKVTFVTSAVEPKGYPFGNRPEVAIVGRSNAGKSSFINGLANQRVAKVSQTPGKTTLLNFFDVGTEYRLVDMPGYGYAARGAKEVNRWSRMISEYIETREELVGLILIMDVRRDWSAQEQVILDWMNAQGLPVVVALNKCDKLSRNQQISRRQKIKKSSLVDNLFLVSAWRKQGVKELEEFVFENWIRNNEDGLHEESPAEEE